MSKKGRNFEINDQEKNHQGWGEEIQGVQKI